jgi:PadR family transcriptional regulator PadR
VRLFRELRRGSTKVLILSQLNRESMYGYQILKAIREGSESYFDISEGSLYPALHSLEKEGLVRGDWKEVDGRPRRYYSLTTKGKAFLHRALKEWEQFSSHLWDLVAPREEKAGAR